MKLVDAYEINALYPKLSTRTDLSIKTTYKLVKFFDVIKSDASFYREKLSSSAIASLYFLLGLITVCSSM